MIDCKRCGVQTSSDVEGWHADCELIQKLEAQLEEVKVIALEAAAGCPYDTSCACAIDEIVDVLEDKK